MSLDDSTHAFNLEGFQRVYDDEFVLEGVALGFLLNAKVGVICKPA